MQPKDRIIITVGTFDVITPSEIDFLKKCRSKGDWLIVGVHTDIYLAERLIGTIQNYQARKEVLKNLKWVDEVFTFDDRDGTVCQLLKIVKLCYPNSSITFMSQKDMLNTPETKIRGINFEVIK